MLGGKVETEFFKKTSTCVIVIEEVEGKKRITGYYATKKKGAPLYPVRGNREFLSHFIDSNFDKKGVMYLMGKFRSLEGIWAHFFEKNRDVTYIMDSETKIKDSTEKDFQQGPNNEVLAAIFRIIQKKNYLYVHPANEEGTIYDVMILKNRETNTFDFVGQIGNKDILMYLVNTIDMSSDPELKEWFASICDVGKGALKSKRNAMEIILGIVAPLEEYRIREIVSITNNPEKPNYNFLDLNQYDTLPEVPTPSWDDFIRLFNSDKKSDLFKAWVYSIFNSANQGRQWLWLQGSGSDGKSSVVNAIQKYMDQYFGKGKSYHSATSDAHKSQFFGGGVYNKRLLIFGDNRDRKLFHVARYLGISGGDHMSVEFKFAPPFSAKVYAKILVVSNFDPYINFSFAAEASRALILKLDPLRCYEAKQTRKEEATYEDRLVGEFPYFMKQCKEAYYRCLKPGSHDFIIPIEVMDEMKATCATDSYNMIQYFLHCCLEYSPTARVRKTTLDETFKLFCDEHIKGIDYAVFSGLLQNELAHVRHCRYMLQASHSGIKTQYILGCKLKDVQPKNYATVLREEDAMDRVKLRKEKEEVHVEAGDFEWEDAI